MQTKPAIPAAAGRKPKLFERHWPWLLFGLLASCGLFGLVSILAAGILESIDPLWLGKNVRGYTAAGYALGVLAVLLAILAFFYSVRKRSLQEKAPFRSTMMAWLWSHVYLGLLALVAAALHGGYGLFSLSLSTGKLVFWIFALLVLSGIAWRIVYSLVPKIAQPKIRNYSQKDAAGRARMQEIEIEKLAAGETQAFRSLAEKAKAGRLTRAEVQVLSAEERKKMDEIARLADSRRRALDRLRQQDIFHRILQAWRALHVPLAFVFIIFFVVHLIAVFDLPSRIFPAAFKGFASAQDCAQCHQDIVDQWQHSMHAFTLSSPVTIAQANQVIDDTLLGQPSPDPYLLCVNCHGPVGASITGQARLPLDGKLGMNGQVLNEGVNCSVCHQFKGEPVSGGGGLSTAFQAGLKPGRIFFGPLEDPVGNAYHRSQTTPMYSEEPERLCMSCHNLNYDLNGDGKIEVGVDLILQTTYTEYEAYREGGGSQTCLDCHMPVVDGADRAAEAAAVPLKQDYAAPPRTVRNHAFVGVDYPLDHIGIDDPFQAEREALLQTAATLARSPEWVFDGNGRITGFELSVTNSGAGHKLPTGKGYGGQMWLEVVVEDSSGIILFESGLLASPTSDLCDAETLNDAMAVYVRGCPDGPDEQLVSFQQKLLDQIDVLRDGNGSPIRNDSGQMVLTQPADGAETWLQHLTSGSVPRVRPADGQTVPRLNPGETHAFIYTIPLTTQELSGASVRIRLLYRNLAPYFLRALAENQAEGELPELGPLIENQPVIEMSVLEFSLP